MQAIRFLRALALAPGFRFGQIKPSDFTKPPLLPSFAIAGVESPAGLAVRIAVARDARF